MGGNHQGYGCAYTGYGFVSLVVVLVAGWLVYGSLGAGFWMAVLWLALGFAALVGLIPVAGPFLYWRLATQTVMPTLMTSFDLSSSWLASAALWLGLATSIIWTVAGTVIILVVLANVLDLG